MPTKKQLAIQLSKLQVFADADAKKEQYPTDSEIAAEALWQAHMHGLVEGKKVSDFGCGTGILGIGCLLLGAEHVDFVDNDTKALSLLEENLRSLQLHDYEIIGQDVQLYNRRTDLVVQNPPFGTRRKHADTLFLEKALSTASAVLTFHKTSTRNHISALLKQHKVVWRHTFAFPLKKSMPHHTRPTRSIGVDAWLVSTRPRSD